MNEAELISLFLETSQSLDSNFEFWLTVSFGLLVAILYFVIMITGTAATIAFVTWRFRKVRG